jgi:hypothetical protein
MIYDVDLLTTLLKSAEINLGSSLGLKCLLESDRYLETYIPLLNSAVSFKSIKLPALLSRSFRLLH